MYAVCFAGRGRTIPRTTVRSLEKPKCVIRQLALEGDWGSVPWENSGSWCEQKPQSYPVRGGKADRDGVGKIGPAGKDSPSAKKCRSWQVKSGRRTLSEQSLSEGYEWVPPASVHIKQLFI